MTAKESEWQRRQRRTRERALHVAAHGPGCQICGAVPKAGGLHQDHEHGRDGRTRGWLCHRCNRAMWPHVTVEWLLRAAMYLQGAEQPPPLQPSDYLMVSYTAGNDYLERSETP